MSNIIKEDCVQFIKNKINKKIDQWNNFYNILCFTMILYVFLGFYLYYQLSLIDWKIYSLLIYGLLTILFVITHFKAKFYEKIKEKLNQNDITLFSQDMKKFKGKNIFK